MYLPQAIVDRSPRSLNDCVVSHDKQEIVVAVRPRIARGAAPKEERELWFAALQHPHNAVERLVCRSRRMSHVERYNQSRPSASSFQRKGPANWMGFWRFRQRALLLSTFLA